MPNAAAEDPRLDPRIRTLSAGMPSFEARSVQSRDELLAAAADPAAMAAIDGYRAMMEMCDTEAVVSSAGLTVTTHQVTSATAYVCLDESSFVSRPSEIHGRVRKSTRDAHYAPNRGWE